MISKTVIASRSAQGALCSEQTLTGDVSSVRSDMRTGEFSTENIDVVMESAKGSVLVCQGSRHKEYSEEKASKILAEEEIHDNRWICIRAAAVAVGMGMRSHL